MASLVRICCVVLILFFEAAAAEPISLGTHYVKDTDVIQRSLPSEQSASVGNLKKFQRVMIYEIKGEWARISPYNPTQENLDFQSAKWVNLNELTKTPKAQLKVTNATQLHVKAPKRSEIKIPRSTSGDKGKYYLLEKKISGDVIRTVHKRVGIDSVGFTALEINCGNMMMRELGYSEVSVDKISNNPTNWFELVPGSSKSDLAHFVCN